MVDEAKKKEQKKMANDLKVKVEITETDLVELLTVFAKKAFNASRSEPGSLDTVIQSNCEYLTSLDYISFVINNAGGRLCVGYPPNIIVPEAEHDCAQCCNAKNRKCKRHSNGSYPRSITPTLENENSNDNVCDNNTGSGSESESSNHSFVTVTRSQRPPRQRTIYEETHEVSKIREYICSDRFARCRQRFVVPVIYFRGQYICRSATLSLKPESYTRYAYDYVTSGTSNGNRNETQKRTKNEDNSDRSNDSSVIVVNESPYSYDVMIKNDIALLKALHVKTIVDLMVENGKVKYLIPVSSSEKAIPEYYGNFNLIALPYPGCEFFKEFRGHSYMADDLHYDWDESSNDAKINIPENGPAMDLDINWEEYRKWDLIEITQNYLKAIFKYVQEDNSGLLVHCISGWDRTPLFISLIRLSLWADGLIHKSLNPLQITYFTVAYDWYLFGHQLPSREKRGEDILSFCFHMLKFIISEEYSLGEHRRRTKTTSSSGSYGLGTRNEDEAALKEELYLASCDQDSNDSYTNNTNCDLPLTDTLNAMIITNASTQAATGTNTINNRSPNSKRTSTSPMTVPEGNSTRQRQESVSSDNSWHVVTETGSIDSTTAGSYMRNHAAQRSKDGSVNLNSSNQSKHSNGSTTGNSESDTQDSSISAHNLSGTSVGSVNGAVSSHTADPSNVPPTATVGIETAGNAEQAKPSDPDSPLTREKALNTVRAIFVRNYSKGVGLKLPEGNSKTGLSINLLQKIF